MFHTKMSHDKQTSKNRSLVTPSITIVWCVQRDFAAASAEFKLV